MLLRLVRQMNLMLILSCPINIQARDFCVILLKIYVGLCSDTYRSISLKFSMMINNIELYIFILV